MRHNMRSRAHAGRISVALILSYAFDWFVIIAAAAVGAVLSIISPNKRPFALNNSQISFPFVNREKITAAELGIIACVAPAVIIFAITIILVPGPTVPKSTPKPLIWRRKLWEWHTGWLGLALALASSFLITQGMKNLFGKPRPDLLSRCNPNVEEREKHILGGFDLEGLAPFILYSATICRQPDKHILDDGFRSFPSGHSSFSSAGLIYLSLFIASKLAITIPFLPASSYSSDESRYAAFPSRMPKKEQRAKSDEALSMSNGSFEPSALNDVVVAARNQAAAPPVYLLIFAIIPFFASIYISSSRFSDFRHHGFDILFGYLIGAITAIFAFRWYHLPISQGAGWSWGPRSSDRAFWAGVGVGNYVGYKAGNERVARETVAPMTEMDMESGHRDPEDPASHDVGVIGGTSQKDANGIGTNR